MLAEVYQDVIDAPRKAFEEGQDILQEHWFAYLLFIPTLIFLIVAVWVPFLQSVWMSFHIWPAFGDHEWVGLGNYQYLLTWDVFYTSVRATIIYMSMTVIQLALALGASLAARNLKKFDNIVDGIFLIPYTMPPVVTGTVWLYLLDPLSGPFFGYLVEWGILANPIYWGSNGTAAITVVTLVGAWTFWQFMYLIFVASLQGIPDEHYETARIYGANRIQQFIRITLPQLKTALLIALSVRIIRNFVKVSQPIQMTQGGPGYQTSVLAILLYRLTLNQGNYGLASAVGVILFLITIVFMFLFIREFRREHGEEAA